MSRPTPGTAEYRQAERIAQRICEYADKTVSDAELGIAVIGIRDLGNRAIMLEAIARAALRRANDLRGKMATAAR